MGEPQDAPPVFGDLNRHALADPTKPVELVVRELSKIPYRRVGHYRTPMKLCRQSDHRLPMIVKRRSGAAIGGRPALARAFACRRRELCGFPPDQREYGYSSSKDYEKHPQ